MKNKFWEYYPIKDEEIKDLWEQAIFIFDTNVLFNLYRYSDDTSKEFIQTIKKLNSRIWLPFQIVKEFHKNRFSVINTEKEIYDSYNKKLNIFYEEFANKNRNPFLSLGLNDAFRELKEKINIEMEQKKIDYENRICKDDILENLTDIFNNLIGEDFTPDKINEIKKEGEIRYKNDIPPGYEDKKKQDSEKFGDLIIWYQIIEISVETKKPIIFITDDRKEDWWLINLGKTISPRPELLKEFKSKTNQIIHFYKPFQFLKYSNSYLGNDIKKEIIQEVKDFYPNPSYSISGETRLELVIKCLRSKTDLIHFSEIINNIGYQSILKEIDLDTYQVILVLPNIPDLERRFKEKYLSMLDEYYLQLIDYKRIPS